MTERTTRNGRDPGRRLALTSLAPLSQSREMERGRALRAVLPSSVSSSVLAKRCAVSATCFLRRLARAPARALLPGRCEAAAAALLRQCFGGSTRAEATKDRPEDRQHSDEDEDDAEGYEDAPAVTSPSSNDDCPRPHGKYHDRQDQTTSGCREIQSERRGQEGTLTAARTRGQRSRRCRICGCSRG